MFIKIDKESQTPIYMQIANQIKSDIYEGVLVDGFKLPSERKLAADLGVHRNTITKAYMELKAENFLTSQQGKGYRINYRSIFNKNFRKKAVNWDAIIRYQGNTVNSDFDNLYSASFDNNLISFAGGLPAREPYPPEEIADVIKNILKNRKETAYFHTPVQGDLELRNYMAKFMATKGIMTGPGNIQIFSENNQALDYILSMILKPGEKVIIDETMSPDVYRTIEHAGGQVICVPSDENGMLCDNLDILIEKESPKLIYVDSSFNNPTGTVLSVERRRKLLELSYRYRLPIIEEDEGSELYYNRVPPPSIKSMDIGSNVIYMYSFSLSMVPGIGVSFIIADKTLVEKLCNEVAFRIVNSNWTAQMVTLEYIKSGLFFNRLEVFREICRTKRDAMCVHLDHLAARYGFEYSKPEGGVFIWVRLPGRLNAKKLLKESQKMGITFIPGYVFFQDQSRGRNYLRLNFSYPSLEQIDEGMKIFEKAVFNIM